MSVVDIEYEADRIQDAYDTIEQALVGIVSADDWRSALGFIEASTRYGYQLRKRMLTEAINHSRVEVSDV